ncbi:peptidase S66 [Saccharospirillum sp. MSK14-1]|uniref:S66 family peptidase n=1 Tax=Saccharospirillum sp. MSK14-1 TaxID=1897632 RepID=UPI000D40DA68|nr:S66 peptidase family protein [Saccharospirillum sp. MSK14-1]PTY37008.1 peptidase S66 [Saccharospirillum sp. MSK14-1]
MQLHIPRALRAGDRLAAVSLSWGGPGVFPQQYALGKRQLEAEFGVELVAMPNALRAANWLAQNPSARADDLMQAFADPNIAGVVSTIGGDDSIRLLPFLDFDVLRANPKVFLGYSDSTITHLACLRAGVRSYYGPSIMAGFGERGGLLPFMVDSVRATLFEPQPQWTLPENEGVWSTDVVDWDIPIAGSPTRPREQPTQWQWLQGRGEVRGHLLGGCMDSLNELPGTPLWPTLDQWQDAVLFMETSEEAPPPDRLLRFIRSLDAMGVLRRLNGILLGRPGGCRPEQFADYDRALLRGVRDEAGLAMPLVTHLDFGHTDPMWVLPVGATIAIDCDAQQLRLCEPSTGPSD